MHKYLLLILTGLVIFSSASIAQPGSHFDVGLQEFMSIDYLNALHEFELGCEDNPKSIECRFYHALSLYYLDRTNEARKEFQAIADEEKGSQWGLAAASYVYVIDLGYFAPLPEKDFNGCLNLSYETDDNITYSPFLVAAKADNKSSSLLSVSYNPLIFSHRPLSISYNAYGLLYDRNSSYDVYGGSLDIQYRHALPWESFATFLYDCGNYYLNLAPYYSVDYIEARYSINLPAASQSWTSLYIGGTNNFYKTDAYKGYNGYESKTGIRYDLSATTYFQYEMRMSATQSNDFANIADEYSLGETVIFPFFHRLYTVIKYTNKFFKYDDSIANELRHDSAFGINLSLSKDISRYWNLVFKYSYTNYTSNLGGANSALGYGSYKDHVLSLSILYKF